MHELDGSFKQAKLLRAARRRRRILRRVLLAAGLVVIAAGIGLGIALWPWLSTRFGEPPGEEPVDVAAGEPVYIPAIVDLAGDPMTISLGLDTGQEPPLRLLPRPPDLPADRVANQVAVLTDVMITSSQRFMTTLPSSPSDFAFYQAQRQVAAIPVEAPPPEATDMSEPVDLQSEIVAGGAGWGDELGAEAGAVDSVQRTSVENTTSIATTRSEDRRYKPDNDIIVRILSPKTIAAFFAENQLPADAAAVYGAALTSLLDRGDLLAGDIVAVRSMRANAASQPKVVQMSLYTSQGYVGTLALDDAGIVGLGADPWVPEELFNYRGEDSVADPGRQYRLLDAIYSTAARNRVPTGILGEAIMLLSRRYDLNAFTSPDDRLVLAYAQGTADEGGVGRVLYAAISGPDRDLRCYVFRPGPGDEFSCFSNDATASAGAGFTAPVQGVLTSKFGPRMHPIFHEVRVHTGVDWAAPSGSPVSAAFAGTIAYAGDGGGYGNLLKIAHGDGRETWYAHLMRFADGVVAGKPVAAGELVGYVGTTGNSTGPHLHFELRIAGAPSDPLQAGTVIVASATGDAAVDALTEQIVQVESGGNATAQNPLSTATGAGQFIQSTWLRMMRTYRPDLARSMSETELLALRNDPTISREMVQNLAREGEAYLKARGHGITAGRLYLAHFLGMEDAHRVLSTQTTLPLDQLLSASVMDANPFLKGHDVAYVIAWAERKMSATPSATGAPVQVARPPNPQFELYRTAINQMLAGAVADSLPVAVTAGS
ncbi:peptidoglycan DD-metalloendopeptidase family protein [Devosia sp. Root635]|uniref:peptidoglycan DD-metalloendopeptidase family protein n=1 Tax=Devosia sp. Root635 TaxID=1736575 RepID=UPI0006FF7213|nr:M23 family metallopeptidase [Devosia sp. Root635]KRA53060.1 hypothetical protein ASD80_13780 [Devosia sp. Root635]